MKKELVSLFLLMPILLTLSGCGGRETSSQTSEDAPTAASSEQALYVPEFLSLEGENIDYDGMRITTDALCYLSYAWSEEIQYYELLINTFSLRDRTTDSCPLAWPEGPRNQAMIEYTFGKDESLYVIAQTFPTEEDDPRFLLCNFHPEGKLIFSLDVTEQFLANPEEGVRINAMETDSQGRIYIAGNSAVWLYDEQGKYQGKVSPANLLVSGLYCDGHGNMYVSYGEAGYGGQGDTLAEIDFESKVLTVVCEDFPTVNTFSPHPGQSFFMQDRTNVYTYDPAAPEQAEILFGWMDCDISGQSVLNFGQTSDGSIAAVLATRDRSGELALLTKVSPEEAVQKETLVLGVLTGGYNYEPAVVRFNRSNEKYRIILKEYYNYDAHGDLTLEDSLAKLHADLVSDHCPDLLEVTGLNLTQLAANDVLQDLRPYLEKSSVFGPGDFISEILEAYTFDDTLVTIPYAVFLETVMGNAGLVGPEAEWTPEKVIALAEGHPDTELFDGADRTDILNFLMKYGEVAFVDWESGKCSFDSEQFKNLLTFVKGFPETVDHNPDRPSTPSRIQNGEVLLKTVELYNFDTIQIDLETFGSDAVCIGYPTADGGRHAMTAIFSYAIASGSKNKDGAWAFIESILSEEGGSNDMGFPSMRQRLEACIEDAVSVKYMLDEKGEVYLDENGEPVVIGNTSSVQYGDGWSYTYHTATREEAELILSLFPDACPAFAFMDSGNEIRAIISEEAEAFYAGQKTVEETAKIIQNRAQLYMDENR